MASIVAGQGPVRVAIGGSVLELGQGLPSLVSPWRLC